MAKRPQTVDSKVLNRIFGHGRGWVFTPSHFLDLGSREAVAAALTRHKRSGAIRQLARGLYDYPRPAPRVGLLPPSIEEIAKALQSRDATRLQVSGAHAANILGLTDQVPVRTVYLTDGGGRKVNLGKRQIVLKHTTPRRMATAGRVSGTVIQALRWIGQGQIDKRMIASLNRNLSDADKAQLAKDVRYAPSWVGAIMRQIAASARL
jgi:hypothetical protein